MLLFSYCILANTKLHFTTKNIDFLHSISIKNCILILDEYYKHFKFSSLFLDTLYNISFYV